MAQDRLTHKEKKQQKVHFYAAVLLQSYTPVVGCYSGWPLGTSFSTQSLQSLSSSSGFLVGWPSAQSGWVSEHPLQLRWPSPVQQKKQVSRRGRRDPLNGEVLEGATGSIIVNQREAATLSRFYSRPPPTTKNQPNKNIHRKKESQTHQVFILNRCELTELNIFRHF